MRETKGRNQCSRRAHTKNAQRNGGPLLLMKRLLLAFLIAYQKGIDSGNFYEEPIGDDYVYPDW